MTVRAIFEKAPDGGWHADVPEVPGCSAKGRTIAAARHRLEAHLRESCGVAVEIREEITW